MRRVSTCPWCGCPIFMERPAKTLDEPTPEPEIMTTCGCRMILERLAKAVLSRLEDTEEDWEVDEE